MKCGQIQLTLRKFAAARGWKQYHTPKNLAAALSVEASELLEIFQWLTPEESWDADTKCVREELGDILIYGGP
jgi:NTP pyrophosphatase (non-canonical NTP hydrolase)